jgi:hypothetical protein
MSDVVRGSQSDPRTNEVVRGSQSDPRTNEVFVVLSMDMGNVPLAVYDSFEAAKRHADDIFTRSNKHACVAKFRMNVPGRGEVLDNVYDVFQGLRL